MTSVNNPIGEASYYEYAPGPRHCNQLPEPNGIGVHDALQFVDLILARA